MAIMMGIAIVFCMGNASHIIDALAPMVLGIHMLVAGILLIFAFVYHQPQQESVWNARKEKNFMVFSLRYFAPALLSIILAANLWQEIHHMNLAVAVRWGWLFVSFGTSAFIVYYTSRSVNSLVRLTR
jgi:NSS family neurotransmitter:Na+ symporter